MPTPTRTPTPTAVKQYVDPHPTGGRHNSWGGDPESQDEAKFNRNSWGGDPESQGQIDTLLPKGPVIICFIIPLYKEDTQRKKKIILIGSFLDLAWF